ncbi:expressed unknown protein [Seminavis robusta]|uniref:Uncharacterized protein n=1 Tax=Seminavis robusta TaxID=568900 RepID=A0A9N8H897_9STRA|nr:expressed unknown protein [Seminavis robusta]|eukprot:Sro154_g069890.1 n/a (536) ;mRNA; r:19048-20655
MPSSLQTPLLADSDHDAALGGPPQVEEESALSRLIAESTPPSALLPVDESEQSEIATPYRRASGTTILAGTLVCLMWGFIWGAFFSAKDGWLNTHLQINIGWISKYLPVVTKHTDVVIVKTTVFSMASNLGDDKSYASEAALWFCSVVLPCVFMIVCPIWILSDFSEPPRRYGANGFVRPNRLWLELSIRLSWLVMFILLALDVAIGGLELTWDETDIQVHNELKGGYLSYLLGCTCATLAVVVLRLPYLEHLQIWGCADNHHHNNNKPQQEPPQLVAPELEPPPPQALRAPPLHAFRMGFLSSNDLSDTERADNTTTATDLFQQTPFTTRVQPWKSLVAFQLGILALLLWIPAMALPTFRVLYDGMVVQLVKTKAFNTYIWQLPLVVWRTGVKAGTDMWMLVLTFGILLTVAFVIPVMAHAVASMIWWQTHGQQATTTRANKLRDILKLLHPAMCQFPCALAMLVTVGSFDDVGENIDGFICVQIENVVENQCLVSGGVILSGCWFLVAQAVALEAFVYLTLLWTAPKRQNITV